MVPSREHHAIVCLTMIRLGRVAIAYLFLSAVAIAVAMLWQGALPWAHPDPWVVVPGVARELWSLAAGLVIGLAIVLGTRQLVVHFGWARRLHVELRPLARGLSNTGILVVALLSSVGEELLFRGVLQPWLGLVLQACVFGLLHYLPGASRWAWAVLAAVVGLVFGALYQATGSLLGPMAAHAVINGLNLRYLRRYDPEPRRSSLGGLLGQRG